MVVSKKQVRKFHRDGFVGPIEVVPRNEMAALSEVVFRHATVEAEASRYRYGFHSNQDLHFTSKAIFDLATHPKLVARLQEVLGPNVLLWSSKAIYKPPADGNSNGAIQYTTIDWHQELDFTGREDAQSRGCTAIGYSRDANLKNMPRCVVCWLAIDDVTEDNGAMVFVPGSQRLGPLPNITYGELATKLNTDEAVLLRVPMGWCVLLDNLVFHKSIPNRSNKRRLGLTFRYVANDTPVYLRGDPRGYDLDRWGCIQVAGRDDAGMNKIVEREQLRLM